MIPELGHFALILALLLSVVQSFFPLWGAARGRADWIAVARPAAQAQVLFVVIAYACLTWSFVVSDFSVVYVQQHSNSVLPLMYRLSAVWGAHEGSILLWVLTLSLWTLAVTLRSGTLPSAFSGQVIGVMGLISIGFIAFTLFTSNPFMRQTPVPLEGYDLNPLLQDPGMAFHPPLLYIGYVGFSVVFAFAIVALLTGRMDAAWARWCRPWTTVAWVFLTLGIALGAWWAYYELGWGGWWFWDPVENASFMPWLVGTALLHSLAVTEKRGLFKSWTLLLAIFAFSLSLLGTFLVRSGVLTSVHAFATDPTRGSFILAFLFVVVGGSLLLYAFRAPKNEVRVKFELFSRESMLLLNNVLLVVAAASVLLGTLYPLLLDALSMGKISVGPPYFSSVFSPLVTPIFLLAGVGILVSWRQAFFGALVKKLVPAMVLWLVVLAVVAVVLLQGQSMIVIATVGLAIWTMISSVFPLLLRLKARKGAALKTIPLGFWGMTLAHFALGVFLLGTGISSHLSEEKDLRLHPGDAVTVADYRFTFIGTETVMGANYRAEQALITVFQNDVLVAELTPQKRTYLSSGKPMTEASIDAGLWRDVYVALGEPLADGAWSVRIYYKPFIGFIWLGSLLMSIGGLLAVFDRRYRSVRRVEKKAQKTDKETLEEIEQLLKS